MVENYTYEMLNITHIKKKGLKNIYLSINKHKEIIVKTNVSTTKTKVLSLVQQKYDWIQKHLSKLSKIDNDVLVQNAIFFLGDKYVVTKNDTKDICLIAGQFCIPNRLDTNTALKQLYKQHTNIISEILSNCISKASLHPSKVTYRHMNTRWGSCGAKNQISLNTQLLKFPKHLIEYVIYHELAHIVHKNHSKDFWHLVSKFVPNYKEYRYALRYY